MTKDDIFRFLNANPVFQLATCEGTTPHVRSLMLHKADETGIYFMVGKFKDIYMQLSVNPQVELCFHTNDLQIRISGESEKLDKDPELKQEIIDARPYLKELIDVFGLKYIAVFRVKNAVATVWSLQTEMQPKEYIPL